MNTHRSKVGIVLCVATIICAFMLLIALNQHIVNAAPQTITANAGEDITDYPIGEQVTLDGSGSSGPTGTTLYYTWQIVAWPQPDPNFPNDPGEPDHHIGSVGDILCPRSTDPECTIYALSFFDADDVGTWTIQLTVDDGTNSASDNLNVTILGFAWDEKRPGAGETNYVDAIEGTIYYDDLNFHSSLVYTNFQGVDYWDENPYDQDLPNGHRECHYMQPVLIPVVERLIELASQEGIYLMLNDAWDQDGGHTGNSIHYEGRALDLDSTRDADMHNDKARLGRLAHLAQQVFSDLEITEWWIWNETEASGGSHVHISVSGTTAETYAWDYRCADGDQNCVPHIPGTFVIPEYSGGAVGQMLLSWQGWSANQFDFYDRSGATDGISCEAMADTLNSYIDRGWTCLRTTDFDEALRMAAFWTDMTLDMNLTGKAFPIAMPMEGDYNHWVVIEGAIATDDPSNQGSFNRPGNGTYTVGALRVIDPRLESDHAFAKRFVTRYELDGNIEISSNMIPTLGTSYSPTSDNGEYELVVPQGCWMPGIYPSTKTAAPALNNGKGVCPSQYPIITPSWGETVKFQEPVQVLALAPFNAGSSAILELQADYGGLAPETISGDLVYNSLEGEVWEFIWYPQYTSEYSLSVNAIFADSTTLPCGGVEVAATSDDDTSPPNVGLVQPTEGAELSGVTLIQVIALDNQAIDHVIVTITGPVAETLDPPVLCGAGCYEFDWEPTKEGDYQIEAKAFDTSGNEKSDSINVSVSWNISPPSDFEDFVINDYAFLRTITGIGPDHIGEYMNDGPQLYDTEVPIADYICGVVGYNAKGGDIYDKTAHYGIVQADLRQYYDRPNWQLIGDFSTGHIKRTFLDWFGDFEDRPDHWTVTLLCINRTVASDSGFQPGSQIFFDLDTFDNLGDNVGSSVIKDTEIPTNDYICGISGLRVKKGDPNEDGSGDIIQTYLYQQNGTWFIRADFRTETSAQWWYGSRSENWRVHLLCISKDLASLDGPVPDKTWFLKEYTKLGNDVNYDTGYSIDDYGCGVVGFAAKNGDIDEHNKSSNSDLFLVYMDPDENTRSWHIRANFRTHNNHENWNVNILCARRTGAVPPEWNLSQEETGIDHCMGDSMKCQVLMDESMNLTGSVILKGGGYSGSPSQIGQRCNSTNEIEVYINDRDPISGRPLWTWPSMCKKDGDTITISSNNTYDFRGVSIVDGSTIPFRLVNPNAPPVLRSAVPRLFPAEYEPGKKYGPGMALTWDPTLHSQATYYEIQFSEDNGNTWQVYNDQRDISHGGWINHHGNMQCHHGFYRCLKRLQQYSYRVRVLDNSKHPLTDWSNVVSATSMEWPAHVEIAATPPGPQYPSNSVVTLDLVNTYGAGLEIQWELFPHGQAEFTILENTCQNGSFLNHAKVQQCKLRIWVNANTGVSDDRGSMKLAAPLLAFNSVRVVVTGTDSLGFSFTDDIDLSFRQSNGDPIETSSSHDLKAYWLEW